MQYEIENFKPTELTLDVIEDLRAVRSEVRSDNGRDVQWELGSESTFPGGADLQRSTQARLVLHAPLPPVGPDNKATKVVHKLHLILHNEW